MDSTTELSNYFVSSAFLGSVIVICITIILLVVIKKYLIKRVAYTTKKDEQHQNTFIGVVFNLLQYVVILGCVILIMKLHGVNVTSIVAGLGIVATLIGLALQDTMKDVISGINIYNNNFYKVGDMVNYEDELCEVKYFNARVTKFKSMFSGNSYTVCNSTINSIEKVKGYILVPLTFDFETDKHPIYEAYDIAAKETEKDEACKKVEMWPYADMDDSGVLFMVKITGGHDILRLKCIFLEVFSDECKKRDIAPNFNDERKVKLYDKVS